MSKSLNPLHLFQIRKPPKLVSVWKFILLRLANSNKIANSVFLRINSFSIVFISSTFPFINTQQSIKLYSNGCIIIVNSDKLLHDWWFKKKWVVYTNFRLIGEQHLLSDGRLFASLFITDDVSLFDCMVDQTHQNQESCLISPCTSFQDQIVNKLYTYIFLS